MNPSRKFSQLQTRLAHLRRFAGWESGKTILFHWVDQARFFALSYDMRQDGHVSALIRNVELELIKKLNMDPKVERAMVRLRNLTDTTNAKPDHIRKEIEAIAQELGIH